VYIVFVTITVTSLMLFGINAALLSTDTPKARRLALVAKSAVLFCTWAGLAMVLGWFGVFRAGIDRPFPFIVPGILTPLLVGLWLTFRQPGGREILNAVPQRWLVGIQWYRGLGSMFLVLYGLNYLPRAFALPAGFGDVLVGFGALFVAAMYEEGKQNRKWLVLAWNCFGIADLFVAIGTGFLSAPGPLQRFSFDAPNVLVGRYPLVMIPLFAVPLSLLLHACSIAKLTHDHSGSAKSQVSYA
jgi:hypothetical protein